MKTYQTLADVLLWRRPVLEEARTLELRLLEAVFSGTTRSRETADAPARPAYKNLRAVLDSPLTVDEWWALPQRERDLAGQGQRYTDLRWTQDVRASKVSEGVAAFIYLSDLVHVRLEFWPSQHWGIDEAYFKTTFFPDMRRLAKTLDELDQDSDPGAWVLPVIAHFEGVDPMTAHTEWLEWIGEILEWKPLRDLGAADLQSIAHWYLWHTHWWHGMNYGYAYEDYDDEDDEADPADLEEQDQAFEDGPTIRESLRLYTDRDPPFPADLLDQTWTQLSRDQLYQVAEWLWAQSTQQRKPDEA